MISYHLFRHNETDSTTIIFTKTDSLGENAEEGEEIERPSAEMQREGGRANRNKQDLVSNED